MIRREILNKKWPRKPLGEVVEFLDNLRKPVTESDRVAGPYPYYGANGQQGTINDYLFDEPLVLLAEDGGHFGNSNKTIAYRVDGKCWVNNHAHVLKPKSCVDINYLFYHLAYYDVTPFIAGTTRQKLTQGQAARIPIALPPLPEQRRIAAILVKADALNRKRRESIKGAESLLRSVFLDIFGDPVKNSKSWDIKPFGNHIESIRYGTGSPPQYQESGIPFIRATNIKQGTIVENGLCFISKDEARKIEKCRISAGNLVIVRSGVNAGDCALIPTKYDGTYAAYDLIIELPFEKATFFNDLINSEYGKTTIAPLKRRAGQPHLNADQIKALKFISPKESALKQYVSVKAKMMELHSRLNDQVGESTMLFNSLLHRAFKGGGIVNISRRETHHV